MSFLRDIQVAQRLVQNRWYRYRYLDRDIANQKRELQDYTSAITEVREFSAVTSGDVAVFVYYEPDGRLSPSACRILEALKRHSVQVLLLCSHDLSSQQQQFFENTVNAVVRRDNQGFDFGSYKDGINYINGLDIQINRLLLLNDSVLYSSNGLDEFVSRMLAEHDVVSAHENWGDDRPQHLQSFALSISSHIFGAAPFQQFWSDYVPVSNRVHAIHSGEYGLSSVLLKAARSVDVIYSTTALAERLSAEPKCIPKMPIIFAEPWRSEIAKHDTSGQTWDNQVTSIVNRINATSPIHSGAYLFPKFLGSPLFKKDLVYRERFQFWEVETWAQELLPAAEFEELMAALRRKGTRSSLSKQDHHKYRIGVK